MASVQRKISRATGKKKTISTPAIPRRKLPHPSDDQLIRTLQQRLLKTVGSSEEEGRSPIGVAAEFVQWFHQLAKVEAIAVYLRDEQTRDMTCLAEAGRGNASDAAEWRNVLARAERHAPVVSGALHAFRLHRIGRMDGLILVKVGPSPRLPLRKMLMVLRAVEPWLAVALDHARLTVKYAAKILRIQHMEQVSDVLNSSLPEKEKLGRAVDAAIRLVEAEAGALFLKAGDGLLKLHSVGGERARGLIELHSPTALTVYRAGQPLLITQGALDSRIAPNEGWQAALPVASLVSVPVRAGVHAVGVLEVVNRRSGKPFSNWDVLELASLSNQFGLAIENFSAERQKR